MLLPPKVICQSNSVVRGLGYLQSLAAIHKSPRIAIAARGCYFFKMALEGAFRKSLVVILALAISASMARGQASEPTPAAHKRIPLEVKPPDEPSSSQSPDTEVAPDATSST